ncbi:MAG: DHHA1 domain-containing protein, partial [Bdellovibrionota bacterium]
LLTQNKEEASDFAQFLHLENTQRQQLEKKFTAEALQMVKNKMPNLPDALVLYEPNWHPGVVGLVASRVLEKYYRPTLVFGLLDGKLKGSGRSTHSFNLFAALDEVRHEFISFGGHFHAVGLTLAPEKLPWLCEYLQSKAQELIAAEDKTPPLNLDGKLSLTQVDNHFISRLETFEPYGIENPRTKWLVGPLQIKHIKRIGKDPTQGHAKILFLEQNKEFWLTAFSMAEAFENLLASGLDVQLVIEAKRGFWNNREYVDLSIVDFAPVVYLDRQ